MKHICDNDTSGLWANHSPVNEMTVQDRCGRRNEPPPVLQFLSADKWRKRIFIGRYIITGEGGKDGM